MDGPASTPGRQGPLATAVRSMRDRALFTQEELARRSGLSVSTVRGLESGRILRPQVTSVRLLADALDVSERERKRLIALARGEPVAEVAPAQLPAAVSGFTGRAEAITLLHEPLDADAAPHPVISVITGTAGVGKTALAVHWAHLVRNRFPDGQLYVDLRGFGPRASPMSPAEAIRRFLDALNVSPQRIPADVDAQAGLYRSLLADRRMLVLLDNARDADQVRPLVPGTPGSAVVVTSRDRLFGVVAIEGAGLVTLDLLSWAEARELLVRRLGAERIGSEPEAVDELIELCARLPLALAIVAARAAGRRGVSLACMNEELRQASERLDAFTGDTSETDVRAVFSWSYRAVSGAAARVFRLLGLHPGPDIGVAAAAALAALPPARARVLLDELARAHLIIEAAPYRYIFHDLLRAYAAELAATVEADVTRDEARNRLFDYYLHNAHAAALLLAPSREPLEPQPPVTGVVLEHQAGYEQAMAWFAIERAALLTALSQAADSGFLRHAWQLAWSLNDFLDRQGHWLDLRDAHQTGLMAATELNDPVGQIHAHRGLARASIRLDRLDAARFHLERALDGDTARGDLPGQADTTRTMAWVLWLQGRHQTGLDHARRALALYEKAGDRIGEARSLNNLGWLHAQLKEHDEGLARCRQALDLQHEIGDRRGEAATWHSLGYVHSHLGHDQEAVACYERAIALLRDFDDRHEEAEALTRIGDLHHAAGRAGSARDAWRQALKIFTELDHGDTTGLTERLRNTDGIPGGRQDVTP